MQNLMIIYLTECDFNIDPCHGISGDDRTESVFSRYEKYCRRKHYQLLKTLGWKVLDGKDMCPACAKKAGARKVGA